MSRHKNDFCRGKVRFMGKTGPIADGRLLPAFDPGRSFDHLVGALLEMQRHIEAERFRGFQIDD